MKIAIEGCCHGELDGIYNHIQFLETKHQYRVDLLLICGDFQAIRNYQDLQCMAVPDKYRRLGDFHKYYTGEKEAPILTIIIGGNHEASNYLWELYHGGWVAPNIYFLGHAGCLQVDGVRIAGASGIFKPQSFREGHWEKLPFDNGSMRSIYHIREFNVRRLSLLSSPDIFLSHDWPQSIEQHGALHELLRRKPFFRDDIKSGKLGSPPLMGLLKTLKPEWWFSAHLHVRFEATVVHNVEQSTAVHSMAEPTQDRNPDEITIDVDDFEGELGTVEPNPPAQDAVSGQRNEIAPDGREERTADSPTPQAAGRMSTKFVALDKCLPNRKFLEVIDFPTDGPSVGALRRSPTLTFDPEWLAITRAFHQYLSLSRSQPPFPSESQAMEMMKKELEWVRQNVGTDGIRMVNDCQTFSRTAPGPGYEGTAKFQQPPWYTNPQTEAFCAMLELENKINPSRQGSAR